MSDKNKYNLGDWLLLLIMPFVRLFWIIIAPQYLTISILIESIFKGKLPDEITIKYKLPSLIEKQ